MHFDLAQNQRFQPHHILEHIFNAPTLATHEQKRAAQRCYCKTSIGGVLQQVGPLEGEYQGTCVTISLDHTGGLRIQHGDDIWSEQSLQGLATRERNQQLLRVYHIWEQCFKQAGEKVKAWDEVAEGK